MADLLKEIYNQRFFETYTIALKSQLSDFDEENFLSNFKSEAWQNAELKARISLLAVYTAEVLPRNYQHKVDKIKSIIDHLKKAGINNQNFQYIFLPEIIRNEGLDQLTISIDAFEFITDFVSAEFAVRDFIIKYPDEMIIQMLKWTKHSSENVRRFASEGCRPLLPWGKKLHQFVADPSPILAILIELKNDSSLYVRKSVANSFNDISKHHPTLIKKLFHSWKGQSTNTDWILKHGARTLLKKGDADILALFGTNQNIPFEIKNFKINKLELGLGEELMINFDLTNISEASANFRLEYFIYFVKSNGVLSKKIFKIAEKSIQRSNKISFQKKHKFIDLTTRKHYQGIHIIAIVINGIEKDSARFNLILTK
jgi:3-methyladenine DNA glycosylase AlkC